GLVVRGNDDRKQLALARRDLRRIMGRPLKYANLETCHGHEPSFPGLGRQQQPPRLPAPGRHAGHRPQRPGARGRPTQPPPPPPQPSTLPTVKLGLHAVTRLIVGGNPIYGHSHFNKLLSQHQTAWHTPERVVELLKRCEQAGVNTWQNSYAERTLDDLERFRS